MTSDSRRLVEHTYIYNTVEQCARINHQTKFSLFLFAYSSWIELIHITTFNDRSYF